MTEIIAAPPRIVPGRADAVRSWARPVAAGAATVGATALAAWLHPVAGVVVLGAAGALSWRLRGTSLSPWRPRRADLFPVAASAPRARAFAAGLRWRWDDACVNAGLGAFVDDRYSYRGTALVGASEHPEGVIAHVELAPGQDRALVEDRVAALSAGLEAASARVLGGDQRTLAILVVPPAETDGWT
ncbi:hypothetical protein [uncultured Demequina sp.]|uniref:hypothetical protein n=1 Tax=uncultured Demequina sp. TaxID=693499 RepID=UPI0025DDBF51|nr:hypothetical protein [uncultured Demequina sp.]